MMITWSPAALQEPTKTMTKSTYVLSYPVTFTVPSTKQCRGSEDDRTVAK
jgi:hypothetical protein